MGKKWFTTNRMTLTFVLLGAIIFLFIIVPLIKMIVASDPKLLLNTLLDSEVLGSIWLTLYDALIATTIGCILGVPLAYLLAWVEFLLSDKGMAIMEANGQRPIKPAVTNDESKLPEQLKKYIK